MRQADAVSPHAYVPPGWPEEVRPPGTPDWERTATAWLFDLCPPDYRAHDVLRRHPPVLARFAARHVQAGGRGGPARACDRPRRPARRRRPPDDRGRAGGATSARARAWCAPAAPWRWWRRRCAGTVRAGCEGSGRTRRGPAPKQVVDSALTDVRDGERWEHAVGLLESIRGPARPAAAQPATSWPTLAEEIRDFLVTSVSRTGGHLGPNLGCRRADPRAAPGLRLAARPDPLGHRPPGVRPQDRHRPAGRLRDAAAEGRPVRLPEPGRVRARHRSRTPTPRPRCPTPTASPRPTSCAALTDRHVVAVIGDGALTGGMAWEALNNIAADHDRRLVIVVNDNERSYAPTDRRAGPPPRHAAHDPRLRAVPRVGQAGARPHAGRRRRRSTTRCTA